MGVVLVAVLLIVGAVAAVAYQRRLSQPYGAVSDLDAEAGAHRWWSGSAGACPRSTPGATRRRRRR